MAEQRMRFRFAAVVAQRAEQGTSVQGAGRFGTMRVANQIVGAADGDGRSGPRECAEIAVFVGKSVRVVCEQRTLQYDGMHTRPDGHKAGADKIRVSGA